MPIVQVSRITQRKGLEEDLPQPLAGAELGWATDQRRLFIGNGDLAEGAPVVGNTEILTEFSDLLSYTTAYTYLGEAAGYQVQTGATPGAPVSQSLQQRLDSYAVITDFGAQGDGVTDDTAAINRALFQLYCRQTNPQIRRSLFFPAGVYVVTNTLLIPPYAKLYGEGAESSIISFLILPWAANTAYAAGVLVRDVSNDYYRSRIPVPPTGIVLTDPTYWEQQALPGYVARTADSLQQTGVNIGTLNALPPGNVEITGMRFQTSEAGDGVIAHDVLLIEKARNCALSSVNFGGPITGAGLSDSTPDLSAVVFSSSPSLPVTDVVIDDCAFSNLTRAISTNQGVRAVTVSNSAMTNLHQGVLLGGPVVVDGGPSGFRVMQNRFDLVYDTGISITNCALNATAYNTFYDVANQLNGSSFPSAPVMVITASNNVSIGDMFQRDNTQALVHPRIRLFDVVTQTMATAMAMTSGQQIQIGAYVRGADPAGAVQSTLLDGFTNQTLFSVNTAVILATGGYESFCMEYTMKRLIGAAVAVRTGKLTVINDDFVDDYLESDDIGVSLNVLKSGDTIAVRYTTTATGDDGIIYYSITRFA